MNVANPEDIEDVPQLVGADENSSKEAGPSRSFDRPKIPITLLTGYLGAGKSTLLEYILTADHGYRIAVCMNDFGDTTDIEARTLTLSDPSTKSQSTSFLSLPNGCLCCSVKDLGIAAIEDMVASQPDGVDWVVVELTGVADPAPIAKSFWRNEEMGDLALDGVICVVDSRNVLKQLAEPNNECQRQIASADVILLNKVDIVSTSTLDEVERTVRGINSTLRVHRTERSKVELGELFSLQAYASDTGLRGAANTDDCHEHEHDHDHDEGPHVHIHSDIGTVLIPLPTLSTTQFERLNSFLENLLWEGKLPPPSTAPPPEILRTKGYIPLDDGRAYILQGVTDLFELKELMRPDQNEGVRRGGKVVFIGRGVDAGLSTALKAYVGVDD